MRALTVGVLALMPSLMVGAKASAPQNYPWCGRNASGTGCGTASLEQCTITARIEGGRCEQSPTHKPSSDQRSIVQQETTPAPLPPLDRKQSAMPQATRQQKMQTCEFGAKDQNLTGPARKKFMARCLAGDDAPARKTSAKPKQQP
jgi:hypothetical protein